MHQDYVGAAVYWACLYAGMMVSHYRKLHLVELSPSHNCTIGMFVLAWLVPPGVSAVEGGCDPCEQGLSRCGAQPHVH